MEFKRKKCIECDHWIPYTEECHYEIRCFLECREPKEMIIDAVENPELENACLLYENERYHTLPPIPRRVNLLKSARKIPVTY